MNGVKPWQIVVMVLAVVVVIGSTFYSCSKGSVTEVKQAKDVNLVDIKTGAMFLAAFPERRPVMYPAKNPETSEMTLFPVFKKDGKWIVSGLYLPEVRKAKDLKAGLIVDAKSGELSADVSQPKRADVFAK